MYEIPKCLMILKVGYHCAPSVCVGVMYQSFETTAPPLMGKGGDYDSFSALQ